VGVIAAMTERRFRKRNPLTPSERMRMAWRGNGNGVVEQSSDERGRPVTVMRLVILPLIPPRSERESKRIEVEAWVWESGTQWIEFTDDGL
jgi:hypothetical protein